MSQYVWIKWWWEWWRGGLRQSGAPENIGESIHFTFSALSMMKFVWVWSGHQLRGKWEDFGRLWLLDYYNSANGYVHIPHFVRATFNFLKVLDLIKIQNHISCSDHVAKMTNTNCNFKINRDLYSQTILQCNGFRIMMKGTTPRTRMTDLGLGY